MKNRFADSPSRIFYHAFGKAFSEYTSFQGKVVKAICMKDLKSRLVAENKSMYFSYTTP